VPMNPHLTLGDINAMSADQFSAVFGPVYEHSPWVAERAFARRPFESRQAPHLALTATLQDAAPAEQLDLLRAHPELAGRQAQEGSLTAASTSEQRSAGLNALTRQEFEQLAALNRAYRERFGFPAIIAVRLNSKEAIFHAFEGRLHNTRDQELQNALTQVGEIARLRLTDLLASPEDSSAAQS